MIRKEEASSATGSLHGCNGDPAQGRRQNKNAILLLVAIPILNFTRLF
ncbi:hypothetical protein QUB77_23025 [Microcoleus sp. AT9b-C3]